MIQEEILVKNKFRFLYCIDADDLKSYAFPLGLTGERPKERCLSYNYITDEQLAFYSLFNKSNFKAFVLDDHYEEISQTVHKTRFLDSQGKTIINTAEHLIARLEKATDVEDINKLKDDIEKVREHISLILTIAVGLQADGVEKLHTLQKSGKVMFDEDAFIEYISQMIPFAGYSKLEKDISEAVYDFLRKKEEAPRKHSKYQLQEETELAVVKRNAAHLRDSNAIGKVIDLNTKLQKAKSKTIVLYISSDYKTQNIFYQKDKDYKDIYEVVKDRSIELSDPESPSQRMRVNYHRTSAQLFLRLLCEETEPEAVINNLVKVKEIVSTRELREKAIDGNLMVLSRETEGIDNFLQQRIDKYRKEFEDYSTFIRIDEFKELSEHLNNKKTNLRENERGIFLILQEILQQKRQNILGWRYSVDRRLQELSQLTIFRNSITFSLDKLIQEQLERGVFLELSPGKDYVLNVAHHLPTYFPVEHEGHRPLFREIVSHFKDSKEDLRPFIINFATRLFAAKGDINDVVNFDELVLKRCMLLLLLSNSKYYGDRILEHIESVIKKHGFGKSHLQSHFYYVLVWVLRRNQRYEEALNYTLKVLERFDDPRFYHSLCLVKYCLFEEDNDKKEDNNKNVTLLKESLDNGIKACDLYSEILESAAPSNQPVIKQNINALLNGRAFLQSLGFEHDSEHKIFKTASLNEARQCLAQLKEDLQEQYFTQPTYLHTESLLCLMEYKGSGDTEKLDEARQIVNEALKIPMHEKLNEMCKDLLNKIQEAYQLN